MTRLRLFLLLTCAAALSGCGLYNEDFSCQTDQWVLTGDQNTHPPTRNAAGYLHC
jgi:hypothetical protein